MTARPTPSVIDPQQRINAYFSETAQYWSGHYERENGESRRFRLRHDRALDLIDHLRLPTGARVLDLGAGAGATAIALAQRGFTVEAVDAAPAMVERIDQRARQLGLAGRVSTRVGDAHALSADDGSYNAVAMLGVVPWMHNPALALAEVARVLQPGGWLVVSGDNPNSLLMFVEPLHNPRLEPIRRLITRMLRRIGWRKVPAHAPRPVFHSMPAFDRLLATAGLQKRQGQTFGFGPLSCFNKRLPDRLGLPLDRGLQSMADAGLPLIRSLGVSYLVLAQKPSLARRSAGTG